MSKVEKEARNIRGRKESGRAWSGAWSDATGARSSGRKRERKRNDSQEIKEQGGRARTKEGKVRPVLCAHSRTSRFPLPS